MEGEHYSECLSPDMDSNDEGEENRIERSVI
jgi:hypothetical protein